MFQMSQPNGHQLTGSFPTIADGEFVVISSQASLQPSGESNGVDCPKSLPHFAADREGSEVQEWSKNIVQVSERLSCQRHSLSENSVCLERMLDATSRRQEETQRALSAKAAELAAVSQKVQELLTEQRELKMELEKLRTKEEVWEQSLQDYNKLKNEYNLLTNTKERLESEKAQLQQIRDETLAKEAEKLKEKFHEDLKTERKDHEAKVQEMKQMLDTEREQREAELNSLHQQEISQLQAQIDEAAQRLSAEKEDRKSELESEQQRYRSELERLVTQHRNVMTDMKLHFQQEIFKQEKLVTETNQQIKELMEKHEAEKCDLLEQMKQLDVTRSFSIVSPPMQDANASSICSECGIRNPISHLRHRAPVQLQGSPATSCNTLDVAVGTSEAAEVAFSSIETQTDPGEVPDPLVMTGGQNPAEEQVSNLTIQIDEAKRKLESERETHRNELDQMKHRHDEEMVELKAQIDEADKRLRAEQATHQTELNSARVDSEKALDSERQKHQTELTDVISQHKDGMGVVRRSLDQEIHRQQQQIAELQQQMKDETQSHEAEKKNLMEQLQQLNQAANKGSLQGDSAVRNLQVQLGSMARSLHSERQAKEQLETEHRRLQQDSEQLRTQLVDAQETVTNCQSQSKQLQLQVARVTEQIGKKQTEIDSLLADLDETRNKLCELQDQVKRYESQIAGFDRQAEGFRGKIKQLESQAEIDKKQHELELDSAHRETQTKLDAAGREAQRLMKEMEQIKSKNAALQETVEANAKTLDEKAQLEVQLRVGIEDLARRLRRNADDGDRKQLEASGRQEQLYNRMCEQTEMRQTAEVQLKNRTKQMVRAEQLLMTVDQKLKDAEKFSSDMQTYADTLELELQTTRQKLDEAYKKRDETISMAEDLKSIITDAYQQIDSQGSELATLKQQCSDLRAERSQTEQRLTQSLGSEQDLQTRLGETQQKLTQAEAAVNVLKDRLRTAQTDLGDLNRSSGALRAERDKLKLQVNNLIEALTQNQSNPNSDLLDRHRSSPRDGGV